MSRSSAAELSVVIPTFNRAHFVAPLLRNLTLRSKAYEIIVVDDGSTDETPAVANEFGEAVVYFAQSNRGPAAARNAGFRYASAPILAFLDVDDEWDSSHPEMAQTA